FELEQWQAACVAFDNKDYDTSMLTFIGIADNAKMHFNIGLIYATVDDHDRALKAYTQALTLDPYFAVAFFQRGVSYFLRNDMEAARQDFDSAYEKLRGNQIINYQQLGLSFRLYSCEVLFNRGICQLYLGKMDAGLTDLYYAQKAKMTEEHDVINQAVKDRGKDYSVFSIPPYVIFRPPENRLKQLQGTDMFAVIDKLNKPPKPLQRNNSVLLSDFKRKKKNSNFGMYTSDDSASVTSNGSSSYRYRHDRKVDSRYDPIDDRFSAFTSSSSSTLSILGSNNDTSFYGDFDQELETVYGSIYSLSLLDRERDMIKTRLGNSNNSNHSSIYNSDMHTSTSTSTTGSSNSTTHSKIKVKAHFTDTRILLLPYNITYHELKLKIRDKFNAPSSIRLQYRDEENERVLMIDDDDLFMARQINRVHHHGVDNSGIEKLEIWCTH
ncbi:hypothetical protein BDB01DRAFT_726186, partial [Pilobolus umbonatus]